jgi:hypothetical protein
MQYEHFELQPMRLHPRLVRPSRVREVAGELSPRPRTATRPRPRRRLRPSPRGAGSSRARTRRRRRDKERRSVSLRLGVAAADRRSPLGSACFSARRRARMRRDNADPGFSRTVQRVEDDDVRIALGAGSPRPSDSSSALIRSESWAFIWQPERRDVVALHRRDCIPRTAAEITSRTRSLGTRGSRSP